MVCVCIPEIASHASIASMTRPLTLSIISPALLWSESVQLSWISSFQIRPYEREHCHLGYETL